MKMTVIPIVIGAIGIITKRIIAGQKDLEIRGRVKTTLQHYQDRLEY